jgi:lipoprotein-releasing system ATP-binding protein
MTAGRNGGAVGDALVTLRGVRKSYNAGRPNEAEVLHGIDLDLKRGEFVALIGPSGSGKSTLLNLLGLLERPSAGAYTLAGVEVQDLDDDGLTRMRRETLGFVFQFHHLLPAFSALENVTLPVLARDGHVSPAMRERGRGLLASVGLAAAVDRKPSELSGGMQQRVAIARSLVLQPALVLADEPTGNLDTASSDEVFRLLRDTHAQEGVSFLIVTHDPRLAARCDRVLEIVDGSMASDTLNETAARPRAAP